MSLQLMFWEAPHGSTCEMCKKDATKIIEGEIDSMGIELINLCDEHYEISKIARNKPISGKCDWCPNLSERLIFTRDYANEGISGPVSYVCRKCKSEQHKGLQELEKLQERLYGVDDDDYY